VFKVSIREFNKDMGIFEDIGAFGKDAQFFYSS